MAVFLRRTIGAFCLLLVAGCVTEELVVFKESVLDKAAMKPFLGQYQVDQWPGNQKPDELRVAEKEGEFRFSYALGDQQVDVNFVLSEIPGSKKDLYLLSIPGKKDTDQASMYFIGKADKDQTHIWVVFPALPVAVDHLKVEGGKAKTDDVKNFLTKHGDAFVTANKPQVKLKKR